MGENPEFERYVRDAKNKKKRYEKDYSWRVLEGKDLHRASNNGYGLVMEIKGFLVNFTEDLTKDEDA